MAGGEDQADLLAVASRQLPQRPIEVGAKSVGQALSSSEVVQSSESSQQPDSLSPGRRLSEAEVTGEVAESSVDRDAFPPSVQAEDPRAPGGRMQKIEQRTDRRR